MDQLQRSIGPSNPRHETDDPLHQVDIALDSLRIDDAGISSDDKSQPKSKQCPFSLHVNSLPAARADLRRYLQACRDLVVAYELNRMRKSRIGSQVWFEFWQQQYDYYTATALLRIVSARIPLIAELFRSTVRKLCAETREMERHAENVKSIDEISGLWDEMRTRSFKYCAERRRQAVDILNGLRYDIVHIPTLISESQFIDLKRGIFGLDEDGNYHPGLTGVEEKEYFMENALEWMAS